MARENFYSKIPLPTRSTTRTITRTTRRTTPRTTRKTTPRTATRPAPTTTKNKDCDYNCNPGGASFCRVKYNAPFGFTGAKEGFCFNTAEKPCFSTPKACRECKEVCGGGSPTPTPTPTPPPPPTPASNVGARGDAIGQFFYLVTYFCDVSKSFIFYISDVLISF